jgi:RNA polymerase sigma-70 factor (ECF subfamily)
MTTQSSFEELVETYSGEIFAYLWRLFQGSNEAEDCLQETFLRALRAHSRTPRLRNPRAWLYRIATNTARTQLTRRARFHTRTADLDERLPHPARSVPDELDHRQSLEAVAAAVRALPPKQRAALMMRKYQQLEYDDIAEALGCSLSAARANVYQALQKLRLQLAPAFETERPA